MAEEREEVVGFVIPGGGGGRAAISAAVIAHRVEFLAERGPDGVPNGGVSDSVVNQDDGTGTSAAFLVVDIAFLDFDEMARTRFICSSECNCGRCEDEKSEIE